MTKKIAFIIFLILSSSIVSAQGNLQKSSWFTVKKEKNGILMNNQNQLMKVEFINPVVVRVQYVPEGELKSNETIVRIPFQKQENTAFKLDEKENSIILKSKALTVRINKITGAIHYLSIDGKTLLKENTNEPRFTEKITIEKTEFDDSKKKVVKTANDDLIVAEIASKKAVGNAWKAKQLFEWQDDEALYGLGSHQEEHMNLRGTMQYLYQHNLKASIPVLMSSKGYGLLFDAGSTMIFHDDDKGSFMQMDAVNEIDYYFMYGPEMDQIVSQYRALTGKVDMMPKYIFGYVQSKERYPDQHTLDSIVTRFRSEEIPLDVIVQDWNYWDSRWWGHKKFRKDNYPDPTAMIKNIHNKNAHFMLSIWPSANGDEGTEMGEKGYVLGRGIYDAYTSAARKMYWDYINKNLFSHGIDAWWCDGSEPIDSDWNADSNTIANNPLARYELAAKVMNDLLGTLRANTFSLYHSQGIYENQRLVTDKKRVVNLTRSTYAGQQRYGTIVWNGDTKATWADFAQQIPSGLNYMATGSPYWTIDAGAFFVKKKEQWFWKGDFEEGPDDLGFREFYVRNVQFCQWLPLFRSHGTDFPREPWQFGNPGEPFYESILKQINLRYRLLPYNYSVAAMITREDYTMTRPLVFDFRDDSNVYDLKDQFMFGPAFMVCPITKPMYYDANSKVLTGVSKSRLVYLPKGTNWIDFYTGQRYDGGNIITAEAPIDKIPVFVKQGSIVPMGPKQQYTSEKPNAFWEIRIYPGANGTFTIYEDEGDNYNYEKGKYATIALQWNDKKRSLVIDNRKGNFNGMVHQREFRIILVDTNKGLGVDESSSTDKTIVYNGLGMEITL